MKKQLKSLEEHNTTAIACHASLYGSTPQPTAIACHASLYGSTPQPNGIACPNCGEELMDSNPMVTLTSNPPQKNVCCSSCDYVGYRIL